MKTSKKPTKPAPETTAPEKIKACLYLRMSDKQQDLSIEQQENELVPWAEREGYEIVKTYVDSGKSGSKATHKRTAFLRMISDAPGAEWTAVLTYDVSRFGRLDSIVGSKYVEPLINSHKFLHCKIEGKYDWRSPEGRMIWSMLCEQAHKTSLTISGTSVRGRQAIASMGWWASGKVPFGYDKSYHFDGKEIKVKRNEKFSKGKGWRLKLIESPTEAPVLQEIFKRFSTTDVSLRQLAADLTNENLVCGGKAWTGRLLKFILTDSTYIGISHFGARSHAIEKFNSATVNEIHNSQAAPALIDSETYKAVQLKLSRREEDNRRPHTVKAGLLSGFLICSNCGKRMGKYNYHGKVAYRCEIASKQKASSCKSWTAKEDVVLPQIMTYLVRNVGRELVELSTRPERMKKPRGIADIIRPRVEELRAKVKMATDNALLAPTPAAAKAAWDRVSQWQDELNEAERQLAEVGATAIDYVEYWEQVQAEFMKLVHIEYHGVEPTQEDRDRWAFIHYGLDGDPATFDPQDVSFTVADPAKLRGLFDRLQLRVNLKFKFDPKPTKMRGRNSLYSLEKTDISIRLDPSKPVADNCGEVSVHTTMACQHRLARMG